MRPASKFAVITADIVASRQLPSMRQDRDRKLKQLYQLHHAQKRILSPYTVTAWDEFQVILSAPRHVPRVLWDLRRIFQPLELWIAVGMGDVTEPDRRPINQYAGGEAFENARAAANLLKEAPSKYRTLTCVRSGNPDLDLLANTLYHLQDTLLEGISARQWQTINTLFSTGSQEATALQLGVSKPTISRNLKRGYYWQIMESTDALERLMDIRISSYRRSNRRK